MQLQHGKKVFFLSDFHLGAPNALESRKREDKIIAFLESIRSEAQIIFIMGDMFDFWYEYKNVIPKGFVRILGKLGELTDAGIAIHFFVGNHDMWMKTYFQDELNIPVHFHPESWVIQDRKFYLAHGDGLGPGDHGYKFLKKIFRNPICQWLFGMLPPVIGMGLANYFSRKSREAVGVSEQHFLGEDKEWLMIHSRDVLTKEHFDYFIYGHRHVPGLHALTAKSNYVNLGDWITHFTYAEFDGESLALKHYV